MSDSMLHRQQVAIDPSYGTSLSSYQKQPAAKVAFSGMVDLLIENALEVCKYVSGCGGA